MADTLQELLSDVQNEMERKANALVREDTTNDDLRELAYDIANESAAHACVSTDSTLRMLLASGTLGLGMVVSVPDDDAYWHESPLNLIERNIGEWLSDKLVDQADAIEEEWEREEEDEPEPDLSGNFMKPILNGESNQED